MNTTEKKQHIIREITNTNNELLIDEVFDLLDTGTIEDVEADNLPEEIKIKLLRAMDDYKQGRYISNDQMKEKMQQWLTQ